MPRVFSKLCLGTGPHPPGELTVARDALASRIEADRNRQPTDGLSDAPLTLWVAVRHHHDVTITIAAREIDPASP